MNVHPSMVSDVSPRHLSLSRVKSSVRRERMATAAPRLNRIDSRRSRQLQWPFANAHVCTMNL